MEGGVFVVVMCTSENRWHRTWVFVTIDIFRKLYIRTGNAQYFIDVAKNKIVLCRNRIVSVVCSSPRKEKHSKSPMGEYVVPHKRISRLNPNGGNQGGITKREYPGIANPKVDPSCSQKELIPRCQWENSNKDPSWRQKELIMRRHIKQKGTPQRESPGIFIPKGDPSWRQK